METIAAVAKNLAKHRRAKRRGKLFLQLIVTLPEFGALNM
ncbi:hypothetical protein PMI09_04255 [Rhizobium sp. CF122]|jgi:hypothetical protein|nr:hypothetical protein PMI09_04255 [Rhizobium sp. CF122]MBB3396661.1 hypothetical protein [Rhizobium sp. BK060]MBB4166711.1 hypothetical protein [Rhizobium sp. BK538]TCM77440.1 hypothetical protein EV291_10781 [Rhizobium sp. BK068]